MCRKISPNNSIDEIVFPLPLLFETSGNVPCAFTIIEHIRSDSGTKSLENFTHNIYYSRNNIIHTLGGGSGVYAGQGCVANTCLLLANFS